MNKEIKTILDELYKQQKIAIKEWDNETLRNVNIKIFTIKEEIKKVEKIRIENEREQKIEMLIEKKLNKGVQK